MPESEKNQILPPDALLLAFSAAVGYLMVFAYENGYSAYYGIPGDWIILSPTAVLATIAGVMVGLLVVFWAINVVGYSSGQTIVSNPVGQAIVRALILFVLIVGCLILTQPAHAEWYGAGAAVIVAFIYFVLPLITGFRVKGGYADKLRAQEEIEERNKFPIAVALRLLPFGTKLIVVLAFFAVCGAGLKGGWDARTQEEFLVPSRGTGKAVLRKYGNTLVLASYDPGTKALSQEFSFLDLGSAELRDAGGSFARKKIGPLKLRKSVSETGQAKGKTKR